MVSLLSSKIGGPKGFAPIPSFGELPCEGKLQRRYSHGVGFQIFLRCCVLRNEGFYGGWSANPATNLLIKSNPTAGECPQTQLGTRYGWPLAHKELLRPLTGFVFKAVARTVTPLACSLRLPVCEQAAEQACRG